MADRPNKLKLKLTKTNTNRLKTDTGRQKRQQESAPATPAEATDQGQPPPEAEVQADKTDVTTEQLQDPISLRETDSGKLRRIEPSEPGQTAVAAAAPMDGQRTSETVRLKVVREQKKKLSNILTASQTIHLRPSNLAPSAPGPQVEEDTTGEAAGETAPATGPEGTIVTRPLPKVTPPSAKTLKVAPPTPKKADGGDDSIRTAVTPEISAKNATATLKIRPKSSQEAPASAPKPAPLAPLAPVAAAPAPAPEKEEPAVPADLKATSTMKIRPPAPRTGGVKLAAAAAPDAETTPSLEKPVTASKFKLSTPQKPPAPAEKAPAAASETQVARPPDGTEKTSKLSLQLKKPKPKQAPTVVLPGVPTTPGSEAEKGQAPPAATVAVSLPEQEPPSATVAVPQPDQEAPSATVAVPRPESEEADTATTVKRTGLKLKSGKKPAGGPSAVKDKENQEAAAVAAAQDAPPVWGLIAAAAAVVVLGALTALLGMQVWMYCR